MKIAGLILVSLSIVGIVVPVTTSSRYKPPTSSSKKSFSILNISSTVPSSSATSSLPSASAYKFAYSREIYKPIETTDSLTISGSYSYLSKYTLAECRPAAKFYSDGYSKTTAYKSVFGSTFTLSTGYSNEYSYALTSIKSYLSYGIRVEIGVWSTKHNAFLNATTIKISGKTHSTINPDEYRIQPLSFTNTSRGDGMMETETFKFNNFRSYIDEDVYRYLSLDDITFSYNYVLPFTYKNAYLKIIDEHSAFPYLPLETNNQRNIPLTIEQNSGQMFFKFPTKMYVKTDTLEMSLSNRENFVETNKFYLPINKKDILEGMKLILCAYGLGANEISFEYNITFSSSGYFFNDCDGADYCIIGGIKK